ncbi:MAG TPA: molybdate ABC transporter substrate-binding protein [Gaiellaceae bacterium]|nr:molybdate ABC transporter substrate-binding protein [Gaiellaceae bacterium]
MKLGTLALVGVVAAFAISGAAARTNTTLTVYAAASLTDAFPKIAPGAKFSFAGSNALATQIRKGAPADVFASANMTLPKGLNKDGFCSKPVVFTRNTLVVIVPKSNPANIRNVYDLRKPGVKIVIAASGVPVGTYTLQVLKNMNLTAPVLANVVSKETDVREVLAKIALGEGDAGFVYSTDAKTVPGKVKTIKIPAWAQPKVQYGICTVTASTNKAAAAAFIKKVLSKKGQKIMRSYGFLPRVKPKPKKR